MAGSSSIRSLRASPAPVPRSRSCALLLATLLAILAARPARASLTLLIAEPYGSFGTMMPVGHTAIYLDRLCADGPLRIRACHPDEPQGVVIARYHALGQVDWIATPILQFLYAADTPEQVPAFITPALAWTLRQQYRQRYLETLIPDGTEHLKSTDEWPETAGAAFDRRLWAYRVATSPAQDAAFLAAMEDAPNHHLYRLKGANCADFAAQILNFYFPTFLHPDRIADFGVMSPKQTARALTTYAQAHPSLALEVQEIPQLPGTLRRSRPVRGGVEGILKTKRYLATLLLLQPEVPLVLTALYLDHGRWKLGRNATPTTPQDFFHADTTQADLHQILSPLLATPNPTPAPKREGHSAAGIDPNALPHPIPSLTSSQENPPQ